MNSWEGTKMLFQGGDRGSLEDGLWLAAKTQTTRWTNQPTNGPNAATPEPGAGRQSLHPFPECGPNCLGTPSASRCTGDGVRIARGRRAEFQYKPDFVKLSSGNTVSHDLRTVKRKRNMSTKMNKSDPGCLFPKAQTQL